VKQISSKFGRLAYDDVYLEYEFDVFATLDSASNGLARIGTNKMIKALAKAKGTPERITGKIRVEQIDSVRLDVMSKGIKLPNSGFGGRIAIFGSHSGRGAIGIYIEKDQIDAAREFVDELRVDVLNRGRKVEVLSQTDQSEKKTCPDCAELIMAAARKCRYCNYIFEKS
jgi:hypothetical protein